MSRSLVRSLLVASIAWILLLAAGAYLLYPEIGPVVASFEPNPFWTTEATGNAAAPIRVNLKSGPWLASCLIPLAALWGLAAVLRFATRRRSASAV